MKFSEKILCFGITLIAISLSAGSVHHECQPNTGFPESRLLTQKIDGNVSVHSVIIVCDKFKQPKLHCAIAVIRSDFSTYGFFIDLAADKNAINVALDASYQFSNEEVVILWHQTLKDDDDYFVERKIMLMNIVKRTYTIKLFPKFKGDCRDLSVAVFYEDGFDVIVSKKSNQTDQQRVIFNFDVHGEQLTNVPIYRRNVAKYGYPYNQIKYAWVLDQSTIDFGTQVAIRFDDAFTTICGFFQQSSQCVQIDMINNFVRREDVNLSKDIKYVDVHSLNSKTIVLFGLVNAETMFVTEKRQGYEQTSTNYTLTKSLSETDDVEVDVSKENRSFTITVAEGNGLEDQFWVQTFELPSALN